MIKELIDWGFKMYGIKVQYGVVEILLLLAGFWTWVLAYCFIIRNTMKYKVLEMPVGVVPGNLAWELIWSFCYITDLGKPFQWGCRIWLLLDLVVNFYMLQYSKRQLKQPFYINNFHALYLFCLIAWLSVVYTMGEHVDAKCMGVGSALLINVVMSGLYVQQLLLNPQYRGKGFSYTVAWLKMLGTAFITAASWLLHQHTFLLTLGVLSFALDILYIHLFKNYSLDTSYEANN